MINNFRNNINNILIMMFFTVLFIAISTTFSFALDCIGIVKSKEGINIRKTPSSSSIDIDCLNGGDAVKVLNSGHYWDEIEINSLKGYVLNDSLVKFSNKAKISNINGATLKKAPFDKSIDILKLEVNNEITILQGELEYYKVSYDNKVGYIPMGDVKLFPYDNGTSQLKGIIKSSGAVVRKGKGISFRSIAYLKKNTEFYILEYSDGWCKIRKESIEGFIPLKFMDFLDSSDMDEDIPVISNGVISFEKGATLFEGPSNIYDRIGFIPKGSKVNILNGAYKGWVKIKSGKHIGYVEKDKIEIPEIKKENIQAYSDIIVRVFPSLTARSLGYIKKGEAVKVLDFKDGWYKIKFSNRVGYIEKKYVINNLVKPIYQKKDKILKRGFVISKEGGDIKDKNQFPAVKIGHMEYSQDLYILEYVHGGYKIKFRNGIGYISSKDVFIPSTCNLNNVSKRGFVFSTNEVDVRCKPLEDSPKLAVLDYGDEVDIISKDGNYYKICYKGEVGYVNSDAVYLIEYLNQSDVKYNGFSFSSIDLDVRRGAGDIYPVMGHISNGQKIEVVLKEGAWYKIKYGNEAGYIKSEMIYLQVFVDESAIVKYGFSFSNAPISIKRGPDDIYPNMGAFQYGEKIGIISEEGDWYKIRYSGQVGYVKKDNICLQVFVAAHHVKSHGFSYSQEPLFVKRGPDNKYPNIARVFYGEKINIISKTGDWYKIRYGNELGYIKDYKIVLQEYIGYSHVQAKGIVSINSSINVRRGASTVYPVMGTMKFRDPVHIISKEGGWYKIRYNKEVGYVQARYVYITSIDVYPLESYVNIRKGPGINYDKVGRLEYGDKLSFISRVPNSVWIKVKYNGEAAYVHSGYIKLVTRYIYDPQFESALSYQGFPESYKKELRNLHALYPQWIFKSRNSIDWNVALTAENARLANLIWNHSPASWQKSPEIIEAPSWVHASNALIAYALDPRNSLDSTHIFEFLNLSYNNNINYDTNLDYLIAGTFLSQGSYKNWINEIGKAQGVCPFFIVATIIQEQGSDGHGSCISGTVPGYEGLYNFFNIKAYQSGGNSSVVNGLIHARKKGWTNRYKSISGGANFFKRGYLDRGQSNLYFKKFNIVNGVVSHQYMSNVMAAMSEAKTMAKAYAPLLDRRLVFEIPVYQNMPIETCPMP